MQLALVRAAAIALAMAPLVSSSVPSAACAPCHAAIHRSYLRTPMATSSGRVTQPRESFDRARFFHAGSGTRYRVSRDHDKLSFDYDKTEAGAVFHGSRSLDFYIGSGAVARAYAYFVDGFLFQAPVAYYSAGSKWDLSPGFARYNYPYLTRPVLPGCLDCHASRPQPVPGTQHGFRDPPFLESGISCERCHGPGERHLTSPAAQNIINPARLGPARRDSICSQCHLAGEFRIIKAGREQSAFQPGELLSDFMTVLVWSGNQPGMTVTGHVEKLAQSACKQSSGDRLWCGSCHDPHTVPEPAARVAWFRAKCLACHAQKGCSEPMAARRRQQDDCTACHMPRNPVLDAEHVVYTDHSVPKRPGKSATTPLPNQTLIPFGAAPATPRDLGLAYAQLALRETGSPHRDRALSLLRAAPQDDVQVLLYLAELTGNASLYEAVLQKDPTQVTAAVGLGKILMEQGRVQEAARWWSDALARSPGLQLVRMNLAMAQVRTGDRAAAEANLKKVIALNPGLPVAHRLLAELQKVAR